MQLRHALMLCVLRRASTLLRPPALVRSSTARFATDASKALEQRFEVVLDRCAGGRRTRCVALTQQQRGVAKRALPTIIAR